jgi:hypothetical protein
MQEKISDICLRFGSEYPSLGNHPIGGNSASLVTDIRSETQHMTYVISLDRMLTISTQHMKTFFPLN